MKNVLKPLWNKVVNVWNKTLKVYPVKNLGKREEVTKRLDDGKDKSVRKYLTKDNGIITLKLEDTPKGSVLRVTKEPTNEKNPILGFFGTRKNSRNAYEYTRERIISNEPIRDESIKYRRAMINDVPHLDIKDTSVRKTANGIDTRSEGGRMRLLPKSAFARHGFAPNGSSLTI